MKALKGNREYAVTEESKQHYINEGFDIYDDDGEVIAHGKGKAVLQAEYDRLRAELEETKKTTLTDDGLIPILKEFAVLKGIDIGQSSTAKGIYIKIKSALGQGE